MRGTVFETLVVGEFLKSRLNAGQPPDLYFWRDNNGLEADLVFDVDGRLQPVEIKSGSTVRSDYIRAGRKAGRFAGEEGLPPWLVHGGEDAYERSGVRVLGWKSLRDTLPRESPDSLP